MRCSAGIAVLVVAVGASSACGSGSETETTPSSTPSSTTRTHSTGTGSSSPSTTTSASSSGSTAASATSTAAGAWTFSSDAEGKTTAAVKEKAGKNGAVLQLTHDPAVLGRGAKIALTPGTRTTCALGYVVKASFDGKPTSEVLASNVDGQSDVILDDPRELWTKVKAAKTLTIEVPTGPSCRSASAQWTTYTFDVSDAAKLPMDKAWS